MIVMKFGGSSLGTPARIGGCVDLVEGEIRRSPIVVVSACGETTDALLAAAGKALEGTADGTPIRKIHADLLGGLALSGEILGGLLDELETLLTGISLTRELTPRTRDLVMSFGERLSARVFAGALSARGIAAGPVDSFEAGLVTTRSHGAAVPLPRSYGLLAGSLLGASGVPVVTGFLGADEDGAITTLGRSGSDYSASIIAKAVGAAQIQIWTDVDGVMTCDPCLDRGAASLRRLSFEEASELAYYGAKVLHRNTLVPAMEEGIPVRVLNTANPSDDGTMIVSRAEITERVAKSVVYKEDVCLVTLASLRLKSAAELLSASLDAMRSHGVGVHMATTSESTVSLVTENGFDPRSLAAALRSLEGLAAVRSEEGKAIVCVVGEELKGKAGVLGRIFSAVSARGIKARMVSQSASEINVAFLVDNDQVEAAVRALHRELLLCDEEAAA